MAYKPKPKTIDVKGLSVEDIMQLDVNSLGEKDLRAVATRMMSAVNKRIKRLEKSTYGKYSPAYMDVQAMGRKFSVRKVKGATASENLAHLRNEMSAMRKFYRMKTSTVSGWKKYRKNFEQRIGGEFEDEDQVSRFWTLYRKLEEERGAEIQQIYDSTKIQTMLREQIVAGNEDDEDIIEKMYDEMDRMYEEYQQQMQQDEGNGDIFGVKGSV